MRTLAVPLTTFVGRRRELLLVSRLLSSARLVTLVGPGGCGKTRLALELVRRRHREEVVWIDLTHVRLPDDVPTVVAQAIGLDRAAEAASIPHLHRQPTLIVLDNCEHVLAPAAEMIVRVLGASERFRVLATSREPLDVEGELVWRVPALSLPDAASAEDVPRCIRSDAVRLFLDRAQLASPGFVLDRSTCPHVVAICRAVDGLPLALELAAARLRHVTVADLASRIDNLLAVLVGTRRGGDARHHAMRAAIDWSYALLSDHGRRLFRRLAVFAGGFRISAAEAVWERDLGSLSALSVLADLVDKSLVVRTADGSRYRLLEPIREYALFRLREQGEESDATERLARYLLSLAETELGDPMGMSSAPSVTRVAEEFGNIAAVLPWLIDHEAARSATLFARLAQNRWLLVPAHAALIGDWLDRALEAHIAPDAARVHALLGQIVVLIQFERFERARVLADEALAISAELGDSGLEALARRASAHVSLFQDPERAIREYDAAIPLLRTRHNGALALALSARAVLRARRGDSIGAGEDITDALAAWTRHVGPSSSLRVLTLACAADVAFRAGDLAGAEDRAREALLAALNADDVADPASAPMLILPIEFLAHLAALRRQDERAARLSGYTDRRRDETGT